MKFTNLSILAGGCIGIPIGATISAMANNSLETIPIVISIILPLFIGSYLTMEIFLNNKEENLNQSSDDI